MSEEKREKQEQQEQQEQQEPDDTPATPTGTGWRAFAARHPNGAIFTIVFALLGLVIGLQVLD